MIKNSLKKDFTYDTEILIDVSESYLNEFKNRLLKHPEYENLKYKFIIDEKEKTIVHILDKVSNEEIKDLSEEERFFYPLCSREEIHRIFNPKSANDYLLKTRAENIANNIRLHRLFIKIRKKRNNNWSFSEYIDSKLFDEYLNCVPVRIKDKCINIPHGLVHLNEPNGYCEKTPFGNIILISEALQYFLYYMNLFTLGSQLGLDSDDISASFWIAIKTILGYESLDFEIDSRGEIPEEIHRVIKNSTEWQLRFIIGHEYAHHYLDHLNNAIIKKIISKSNSRNYISVYSYQHNLEYEADYYSVNSAKYKKNKNSLAMGAFYFFHFLDLYETVTNYLYPETSLFCNSHPKAIDRLWKLKESLDEGIGITRKELIEYLDSYKTFKDDLINNILPLHVDDIESYGSVYLPSFKKEIKLDRLDF